MATSAAMSRDEIVAFLDEYRAGEAIGASLFRGWVAVCKDEVLRGALKVMEGRERFHSQLLEQRVRDMGGTPTCQRSAAEYVAFFASPTISDAAKLEKFVTTSPPEQVLARLSGNADRMGADPESQRLVRTIIEDESATLWGVHGFQKALAA